MMCTNAPMHHCNILPTISLLCTPTDFHREVVAVALSYLDRYLATRAVNRRIFQLAAMTALYLAIKLYEPGKLRLASLIELSRGYFLAEHIVIMEDSILQSLGWHVHPPTR